MEIGDSLLLGDGLNKKTLELKRFFVKAVTQ